MSESSIELEARFMSPESAEKVCDILSRAKSAIDEAAEAGNELYLGDYLLRETLDKGVAFSSFWYPEKIALRESHWVQLRVIGSPSESDEQDIITWLRKMVSHGIQGKFVMDGGGDVYVEDIDWKMATVEKNKDDLEARDGAGNTHLHLAAEAGNAKKVRELVDLGADIESTNLGGRTPLFMAINRDVKASKAIETIEALLAAGANAKPESPQGDTPLSWARRLELSTIAAFLEENGA